MGKISPVAAKYIIKAEILASGVVEKPDAIGAVFGQTEGLLGPELELRELQKSGRIGRIEVTLKTRNGKTTGIVELPSSMDKAETAIIAAALETIDRVGPCEAKVKAVAVEDVRERKRRYITDRAKNILKDMLMKGPDSQELLDEVRKDAVIYRHSGGGVTISGGEPLLDTDFTQTLLKACKEEGIGVGVDTCGHVHWKSIEQVLPYVGFFLWDIKHMDPGQHQEFTGASNELILNNARTVSEKGVPLYIRFPVIPGYNDSEKKTILEAVRDIAGKENVFYSQGTDYTHEINIKETVKKASYADVIIVCTGEIPATEKPSDIVELLKL